VGSIACPHCAAANEAGSAFCRTCGKALPAVNATGPRIITGQALASTAAGVKLQSDELERQAKKAANALLAVAILQTIFAGAFYLISQNLPRAAAINLPVVLGTILGVAAIFWALYFWARVNPLPAAIVGLVVYVSLWALDFIVAMGQMANSGGHTIGAGPFNGIIIRLIIVLMLVRAIQAGVMHRKLMRQRQQGFEPLQVG